jgi:hypothetical protein
VRWLAVSILHNVPEQMLMIDYCRLAYCELYVTLGTIFRRFGNLKVHGIKPEDLILDDYFSTYHPDNVPKLHVVRA